MNQRPTPPGTPAAAPKTDELAVDVEWKRLESNRLAEEVAEARDDVGGTTTAPPSGWLWGGFAAALLAGVVFAVAVNVALAARRPAAPPPPAPVGFRPPSPNELGPGVGAGDGSTADETADRVEPVDGVPQPPPSP